MIEPTLVYDDDCGFCTWWVEYIDDRSDVRIVGFSDVDASLRDRLPPGYESCSHFVTEEGTYSCGAAMEEALLRTTSGAHARPVVSKLREYGAYRNAREWGYHRVANSRSFLGKFISRPTRG